jgi:hypothetical protein
MSEGTANAMAMGRGRFCVGAAFVIAIWMTEGKVHCSGLINLLEETLSLVSICL